MFFYDPLMQPPITDPRDRLNLDLADIAPSATPPGLGSLDPRSMYTIDYQKALSAMGPSLPLLPDEYGPPNPMTWPIPTPPQEAVDRYRQAGESPGRTGDARQMMYLNWLDGPNSQYSMQDMPEFWPGTTGHLPEPARPVPMPTVPAGDARPVPMPDAPDGMWGGSQGTLSMPKEQWPMPALGGERVPAPGTLAQAGPTQPDNTITAQPPRGGMADVPVGTYMGQVNPEQDLAGAGDDYKFSVGQTELEAKGFVPRGNTVKLRYYDPFLDSEFEIDPATATGSEKQIYDAAVKEFQTQNPQTKTVKFRGKEFDYKPDPDRPGYVRLGTSPTPVPISMLDGFKDGQIPYELEEQYNTALELPFEDERTWLTGQNNFRHGPPTNTPGKPTLPQTGGRFSNDNPLFVEFRDQIKPVWSDGGPTEMQKLSFQYGPGVPQEYQEVANRVAQDFNDKAAAAAIGMAQLQNPTTDNRRAANFRLLEQDLERARATGDSDKIDRAQKRLDDYLASNPLVTDLGSAGVIPNTGPSPTIQNDLVPSWGDVMARMNMIDQSGRGVVMQPGQVGEMLRKDAGIEYGNTRTKRVSVEPGISTKFLQQDLPAIVQPIFDDAKRELGLRAGDVFTKPLRYQDAYDIERGDGASGTTTLNEVLGNVRKAFDKGEEAAQAGDWQGVAAANKEIAKALAPLSGDYTIEGVGEYSGQDQIGRLIETPHLDFLERDVDTTSDTYSTGAEGMVNNMVRGEEGPAMRKPTPPAAKTKRKTHYRFSTGVTGAFTNSPGFRMQAVIGAGGSVAETASRFLASNNAPAPMTSVLKTLKSDGGHNARIMDSFNTYGNQPKDAAAKTEELKIVRAANSMLSDNGAPDARKAYNEALYQWWRHIGTIKAAGGANEFATDAEKVYQGTMQPSAFRSKWKNEYVDWKNSEFGKQWRQSNTQKPTGAANAPNSTPDIAAYDDMQRMFNMYGAFLAKQKGSAGPVYDQATSAGHGGSNSYNWVAPFDPAGTLSFFTPPWAAITTPEFPDEAAAQAWKTKIQATQGVASYNPSENFGVIFSSTGQLGTLAQTLANKLPNAARSAGTIVAQNGLTDLTGEREIGASNADQDQDIEYRNLEDGMGAVHTTLNYLLESSTVGGARTSSYNVGNPR